MKRLLLITLGLVLGYGLGLAYAWYLQPARPADTSPASLRADYQAEYVQWVAHAYAVEGDAARARVRLAVVGDADPSPRVIALAQQLLASGGDAETIQALGRLAVAVSAGGGSATSTPVAQTLTPTSTATETPTTTPTATPSPPPTITPIPLPTQRPTATPIGILQFVNQELICDPLLEAPLLQVLAFDAIGQFVPGVEVLVEWDSGFDHFFTGLQPEHGAGYGDFVMTPGIVYTVRLAASPSAAVPNLVTPTCPGGVGAWQLTFRGQ